MFYDNGYSYLFTTIDQAATNTIPQLKPTAFKFSTYQGASRDVLNMYIATTSALPQKPQFGLQFPLPDDFNDVAMFISNKISFRTILLQGFKDSKNWTATILEGQGDNGLDQLVLDPNTRMEVPFPSVSGVSVPSNKLILPMGSYNYKKVYPGLKITNRIGATDVVCNYDMGYPQKYNGNQSSDISMNFDNVPVQISVDNSVKAMQLSYKLQANNMKVDSTIQVDEGCCGAQTNNKASEQLNENIRKYFPQNMTDALNQVKFQSVSVMMLQSILFDAKYIELNGANNPGDMVLFGKLLPGIPKQ